MRTLISITYILFISCFAFSQDTLAISDLSPFTYSFQLTDGQLSGPGADILKHEISNSQYTMLGEYHGVKAVSLFTDALVPLLDSNGYKTMVLEIGPTMGQIFDEFPSETKSTLKALNQKYLTLDPDYPEDPDIPIPFFDCEEDAKFLTSAKKNNWHIMGIDQEYQGSFFILFDRMYGNLSRIEQLKNKNLYNRTIDSLKVYEELDLKGEKKYINLIDESDVIKTFLNQMKSSPNNIEIINAFQKSIEIYWLTYNQKWYENYSLRIEYMKERLRAGMQKSNFDLEKDKLFIKMGRLHLSKGVSPYNEHEVGNTLTELAEFHGNKCLAIGIESRFHLEEDGSISDALAGENNKNNPYRGIKQMGKNDSWVLIDLKPLIKLHGWYPRSFKDKMNPELIRMTENYDFIIVPPIMESGTKNF